MPRPRKSKSAFAVRWNSSLFRFSAWFLGIRHQCIEPQCPWQNGRIERFFGTLKEKLDGWAVADAAQLDLALAHFRLWYNHVRPHQHLGGATPAEVWQGIDILNRRPREYWFEAWDGLLRGFHLRP